MAVVTKNNSANPYVIAEGIYEATIVAVEEKDGKRGSYLTWEFRIDDPIGEDGEEKDDEVTIRGNTPMLLQDDSKLDKWLKACGFDVDDGESIDMEDVEGTRVKVVVENTEKGDRTYSNVVKIAPLRKKSKKVEVDDDDEEERPKKSKKKSKKTSKKAKKAGKKAKKVEVDEEDDEEEEEEEERPKKSKKAKKAKKVEEPEEEEEEDDIEDGDDDDDDEDDLFDLD